MSFLVQSIFHPSEIVAILYYLYSRPPQKLKLNSENKSKIRCYEFLKQTSRSFAT
ncbi:17593_t:CDS:1, partial [Acaulospora morrowiae]